MKNDYSDNYSAVGMNPLSIKPGSANLTSSSTCKIKSVNSELTKTLAVQSIDCEMSVQHEENYDSENFDLSDSDNPVKNLIKHYT